MNIDAKRLRTVFKDPALEPLLVRMRKRLESGRKLAGTLVLTGLGAQQREAVGSLLGRPPAQLGADNVSVPLDELEAMLVEAGLCGSLQDAVVFLTGPVESRPELRAASDAAWAAVFAEAPENLRAHPFLAAFVERVRIDGMLKRLVRGQSEAAREVLARLAKLVALLPAPGIPLAALAAEAFGDAHALDPGRPLATLAVRAAACVGGVEFEDHAEGRRAAWAAVGVYCDELSTPVLALNLPTSDDNPLARLLAVAGAAGEPLPITLRMLLRHPLSADRALRDREIFVCENPTIVALAAQRLGGRCAPLVCVNGQFATPAAVLLRQLTAAGARLRYHGDFDAGGLAIARRVIESFGARPWRLDAEAYRAAPKGEPLSRATALASPWCPGLAEAMRRTGRSVHEEAVADCLLEDLDTKRSIAG